MRVIVIGAGPAGMSAALHLRRDHLLIEKEDRVGGLGRSLKIGHFVFDYAGHIFFSGDAYARKLFTGLLQGNQHFQDRNAWIYSKGVHTRYPFQSNLYGLPGEVIKECLLGLEKALKNRGNTHPANFDEWIPATFGDGIARHFMRPYNRKVWARPLKDLDVSWIHDRVKVCSLEEAVAGSRSPGTDRYGPNAKFGYPLRGGCQALMDAFPPRFRNTELRLNTALEGIDVKNKSVTLGSGETLGYRFLLSSIPLPELILKIIDAPAEISEMARRLRFTSVYCVNIGLDREKITDKHWIYYPEEDIIFQRLFIQSNASPHVCPPGTSSLTAEISHSRHKPLERQGIVDRVIRDVIRTGLMDGKSGIKVAEGLDIRYGYIIYDRNRGPCLEGIKKFLDRHAIIPVGRYGEWNYFNLDHSFLSGKAAAERVNALDRED